MASTLLTTAQVQAQLETDLPDDELETLIDEADGLIVLRYGAHSGEVTDDYSPVRELVFLRRQAQSIAEIKTRYAYQLWAAATVADPATYELQNHGWILSRPTLCWLDEVQVRYTPVDTIPLRRGVLLDLVKLALAYDARASYSVGDVSSSGLNRERETNRILARMKGTLSGV